MINMYYVTPRGQDVVDSINARAAGGNAAEAAEDDED